jgi:hypothetical protein
MACRGRDVSRRGVCLLSPRRPPGPYVYLHFRGTPQAAAAAVLGRVLRVRSGDEGRYELGVTFAVDGPL